MENYEALRSRQTSDTPAAPVDKQNRVNLLNWDGKGRPPGLFPPRDDGGQAGGGQAEDAGGDPNAETEPKP
ncbi:hypothetical protein SAXI111661_15305 [Saccharomonospora xinjiangensis]